MKNSYTSTNLPLFCAISTLLHIILISLMFFGFPFRPKDSPEEKIITFELLPVSSINNVKTKKVQKDETILNQDAKKVEKSKISENSQPEPEVKKEEVQKEPAKEEPKPEAEKIPDKKEEKKPEEKKKEDKKEEKKPEPKKEQKKEKPKKKSPNNKELDSLLKNLEKESEGENDKSRKVSRQKTDAKDDAFGSFDNNSPESLTNDELIKQQIKKHWNQPIASATENISIRVELKLNKDGSVESADVKSSNCPDGKGLLCQTVQDSVIRAIKNASPLVNLNPDDYSTWQNINFTFNTKR